MKRKNYLKKWVLISIVLLPITVIRLFYTDSISILEYCLIGWNLVSWLKIKEHYSLLKN